MYKNQILEYANYFLKNNSTIRKTAKFFGVSKSTMHNLLHKKLKNFSPSLFQKVQKLLDKNNNEKHIRGGASTQKKFKELKNI